MPLAQAIGGTLAGPLHAAVPLPPFDASAMDGYAVAGAGPWRVVRALLAGVADPGSLTVGGAAEIATGAPVPAGARSVLPYELADRTGDTVRGQIADGRHIRRIGVEAAEGALLAGAGTHVTPAVLGLAASVGLDRLRVRPPARVAIVLTGGELLTAGRPGAGRVRDAVGPMLPGVIAGLGGRFTTEVRTQDDRDALARALAAPAVEIVVTCGASSVGPTDVLPAVLADAGAELVVRGVACKPGHPQLLARLPGQRYVVGLPGNPYAALVAALTLLAPLLAGLAGRALPVLPTAILRGGPEPAADASRIVAVRRVDGQTVTPTGHDRPASLWGAAVADALAVLPPHWAGEPVPLLALPVGGQAGTAS